MSWLFCEVLGSGTAQCALTIDTLIVLSCDKLAELVGSSCAIANGGPFFLVLYWELCFPSLACSRAMMNLLRGVSTLYTKYRYEWIASLGVFVFILLDAFID